jgi:hypothetical protein
MPDCDVVGTEVETMDLRNLGNSTILVWAILNTNVVL